LSRVVDELVPLAIDLGGDPMGDTARGAADLDPLIERGRSEPEWLTLLSTSRDRQNRT
jgi:hypothetical protein